MPDTGDQQTRTAEDKIGGAVLMDEERETGDISWHIYGTYLRAMGAWWWALVILALLLLDQGATVGNSLFLGYWSSSAIKGFTEADYMAIYASE